MQTLTVDPGQVGPVSIFSRGDCSVVTKTWIPRNLTLLYSPSFCGPSSIVGAIKPSRGRLPLDVATQGLF